MRSCLVYFFAVLFTTTSYASEYDKVFVEAGRAYYLDPLLIKAHCVKESGLNPVAYNAKNWDKSVDIGLCQINSWWYPKMKEHGITPDMLTIPTISIYWAAYVINHNFSIGGINLNSIGAYNAGWKKEKQSARNKYAREVLAIYEQLKKGGL